MTLLREPRLFRFLRRSGATSSRDVWIRAFIATSKPLVEGQEPDLLAALKALMEQKRQGRASYTDQVVDQFGLPIMTRT